MNLSSNLLMKWCTGWTFRNIETCKSAHSAFKLLIELKVNNPTDHYLGRRGNCIFFDNPAWNDPCPGVWDQTSRVELKTVLTAFLSHIIVTTVFLKPTKRQKY